MGRSNTGFNPQVRSRTGQRGSTTLGQSGKVTCREAETAAALLGNKAALLGNKKDKDR